MLRSARSSAPGRRLISTTSSAPGLNLRGELLLVFAGAQVLGTLGWGQLAAHRVGTRWVIANCSIAAVVALGLLACWPSPSLWLAAALLTVFCLLASFG